MFISCLLVLFLSFSVCGQSVEDSLITQLKCYAEENAFEDYYKTIKALEEEYIQIGQTRKLIDIPSYYKLLPRSEKDSTFIRSIIKYSGYRIYKHTGNVQVSLNLFLLGNSYLKDEDEYLWNIEKQIANHCARLNDYEKSLYYNSIVKNGLERIRSNEKAIRIYKDLGDNHLWLKDTIQAGLQYNAGLKLSENLKLNSGIYSNAFGVARVHLLKEEYSSFNSMFLKAETALKKTKRNGDYYERLSDLNMLESDYFILIGNSEKALKAIQNSNTNLKRKYNGRVVRELSKNFLKAAQIYSELKDSRGQQNSIDSAYYYLGYTNVSNVLTGLVIPDNSLVELLSYDGILSLNKSNTEVDDLLLAKEKFIKALEINDILHQDLLMNGSKHLSIRTNKMLVDHLANVFFDLIQIDKTLVPLQEISNVFSRSKNLILADNVQRSAEFFKLPRDLQSLVLEKKSNLRKLLLKNDLITNDTVNNDVVKLKSEIASYLKSNDSQKNKKKILESPFLEYIVTDKEIYLFTNIGPSPLLKINGFAEIESAANSLNYLIQKQDGILGVSSFLAERLLPIDLNGLTNVSIILDGFLHNIPFDVLIYDKEYLIKSITVNYRFSHLKSSLGPHKIHPKTLCILPDYSEYSTDNATSAERAGHNSLKYTKTEVAEIDKIWGADIRNGNIKEKDFSAIYNGYDIIHFAGHADLINGKPYLYLSKKEKIDLHWILNHPNNISLVNLSACQTGTGKYYMGEGVSSIASSFVNAGTKSAVYSKWYVNDKSTSRIMKNLYSNLSKGQVLSEALRAAKLKYIEEANPVEKLPYYWAGLSSVNESSFVNKQIGNRLIYSGIFILLITLLFLHKILNK